MTDLDMNEVSQDAANPPVPREEKLSQLATLAALQSGFEDYIEQLEDRLATAKDDLRKISDVQIPEIMQSLGIKKFTLTNGYEIEVKPWFNMSPSEDNIKAAYEWLDHNGHGDIVKHSLTLEVRLTQANLLSAIKALADEGGISTKEKDAIHHMTAGAWVKEQLTLGKPIPRELLGVTAGFKTKIKRANKP